MKQILQATLNLSLICVLASCGTSKSGSSNSSSVTATSTKILASCAQNKNTDISLNISAAAYSSGDINPNYAKIKFNYLSSKITQSGNRILFYKWKVSANQIVYDQTALNISSYDLSTKAIVSYGSGEWAAADIKSSLGYLIELNDSTNTYQVLKMIVLNSSGNTVIAQMNMLIPQFAAAPVQYAFNSDGTARAQDLQNLHPLKGTDTSAWTSQNFTQYFTNYCF